MIFDCISFQPVLSVQYFILCVRPSGKLECNSRVSARVGMPITFTTVSQCKKDEPHTPHKTKININIHRNVNRIVVVKEQKPYISIYTSDENLDMYGESKRKIKNIRKIIYKFVDS